MRKTTSETDPKQIYLGLAHEIFMHENETDYVKLCNTVKLNGYVNASVCYVDDDDDDDNGNRVKSTENEHTRYVHSVWQTAQHLINQRKNYRRVPAPTG